MLLLVLISTGISTTSAGTCASDRTSASAVQVLVLVPIIVLVLLPSGPRDILVVRLRDEVQNVRLLARRYVPLEFHARICVQS